MDASEWLGWSRPGWGIRLHFLLVSTHNSQRPAVDTLEGSGCLGGT